jgi:hypothetical protein
MLTCTNSPRHSRLYTAPVESDVKEKPISEDRPAQLRSSIRRENLSSSTRVRVRRRERDRQLQEENERLRGENQRLLHTAGSRHNAPGPRRTVGSLEDGGVQDHQQLLDVPDLQSRQRDLDRQLADLEEAENAIMIDMRPSVSHPLQLGLGSAASELPASRLRAVRPRMRYRGGPHVTYMGPELQYTTSSLRSTQAPYGGATRPDYDPASSARPYVPEVTFADDVSRHSPAADRLSSGSPAPQMPRWNGPFRPDLSRSLSRQETDGLGDRNRSLSPADGENMWDTLLTTVTPDPHPPSIGGSFASTASASRAATQTSAAASSRTSLTGPETYEAPVESCYNSDSDRGLDEAEDGENQVRDNEQQEDRDERDDEDDELNDDDLTRFVPGLRRSRRSYAEVVAESVHANGRGISGDTLELLSMQRIVRHLARREDIPDEWWAEAGLSRTLSREGGAEA